MAKNRSSHFDLDAGLFTEQPTAPDTLMGLSSLYSPANIPRPLGVTQGRKGQKAKRINMAFSDENYEYITFESRRRGLSATAFVNSVITQYKDSAEGHID